MKEQVANVQTPQQTKEEASAQQGLYAASLIRGITAGCAGRQVREQGRAAPADHDGVIRADPNKFSYLSAEWWKKKERKSALEQV